MVQCMAYDYIIQPKGTLYMLVSCYLYHDVSKFKFRTILHSASRLVICIAVLSSFPKPLLYDAPVYRKN